MAQQYEVTASDSNGKTVKVIVEADNSKNARGKAKSQGLTPISVIIADEAAAEKAKSQFAQAISNPLGGVSIPDLANMTRQLATLVKAHVPLVESLNALIEQIENGKLRKILNTVRTQVNEGKPLADGFQLFPNVFDRVFVNMVRAGESSGKLDTVLLRLADFAENRVKIKNKVVGALTYPLVLVGVAVAALGVIFAKVIPTITKIFTDMNTAIPTPTRILMTISDLAQNYAWYAVIGTLIVGVVIERYVSTEAGRAQKDRFLLGMPLLGVVFRNLAVARFARTLGTLLSSGVPMLAALQITRNVVSNTVFEAIIDRTGTAVSEGRSLAYSLKQSGEFPPIVIHMVAVGEKTGELENMLNSVADNFELQVENKLGSITSLLQPTMMIGMFLIVGFIVVSVLLPILEMNDVVK